MSSTNKKVLKAIKRDRTYGEKLNIKLDAWLEGRNPKITVETGMKKEGFKKIPANLLLGDPRLKWYNSKPKEEKDDSLFPVTGA